LAYIYLVNNKLSGPLVQGVSVTHEIEAHSLGLGVTVRY